MRRSIIIMALCLLTSWTWAQEFQKTTSGIKTTISGKQTDIEIQWFGPKAKALKKKVFLSLPNLKTPVLKLLLPEMAVLS